MFGFKSTKPLLHLPPLSIYRLKYLEFDYPICVVKLFLVDCKENSCGSLIKSISVGNPIIFPNPTLCINECQSKYE